jgi:hypothetical protein
MRWLSLVRPGDWLVVILGVSICVLSYSLVWQDGAAEKVIVKRGGEIFAELDLLYDRQIDVPGPLGVTRLEVRARRVRVVSDPGPRQYCVLQGWLSRAGEVAVCAPNQVSVLVLGRKEVYDSLSY